MASRFKFIRIKPMKASALQCALLALMLLNLPATFAQQYEPRLVDGLDALQYQNEDIAEQKIASLIKDYPNSQAAHLMMSDLYAARAGIVGTDVQNKHFLTPKDAQQLSGLRDEIRLRWNQNTQSAGAHLGHVPASIIQLAPGKKAVVFVDTSEARLYIFEHLNAELSLRVDNYTTIGEKGIYKQIEGDERTPIGVYHVTEYIDGKTLPPLYGAGAFPINYPNVLDKHYQRTGYGIWIHGTHPESFNRVPLASDGCVAMSNPEFDIIRPFIQSSGRTPVIISEHTRWVRPQELLEKRVLFHRLLTRWEQDWESMDSARYLSHYDAEHFMHPQTQYKDWIAKQTALSARKTMIDIDISELSLFAYPGETDMVIAQFTQDYHSNDPNSRADVEQYWQRNAAGDWKIIYEGLM